MKLYEALHDKCGEILRASLAAEYVQLQAGGQDFFTSLETWAKAIAPNREHQLIEAAGREYQHALLALVHGQYRHAFKSLRLVLELCLQAVHLSTHRLELQEWIESRKDTVWAALMDEDKGVLTVRYALAFFPDLKPDVRHHQSLAAQLYRECSECVHGSAQKHIPLPNVLVFDADAFKLWHRKADACRLVINFAFALRYLRDLTEEHTRGLQDELVDRLGHIVAIRRHFGGPEGG